MLDLFFATSVQVVTLEFAMRLSALHLMPLLVVLGCPDDNTGATDTGPIIALDAVHSTPYSGPATVADAGVE